MSPLSSTGYLNVSDAGQNRFRASSQHGGRERKEVVNLGTFPTAVEAAYAYARYVSGSPSVAVPARRQFAGNLNSLPKLGWSPSKGSMIPLLLASKSRTGYKHVLLRSGRRARPYAAICPGGYFLGYYGTAVEAAVAVAEYLS